MNSIITILGGIFLAGVTYWFTKQRERDAELRKEKLEHYKEFVSSLSGIISGESTPKDQRAFSLASNKLMLVAPQAVIEALREFQEQTKKGNPNNTLENHDNDMSILFYEMRRDLNVKPKDNEKTFKVGLWSSGVSPDET